MLCVAAINKSKRLITAGVITHQLKLPIDYSKQGLAAATSNGRVDRKLSQIVLAGAGYDGQSIVDQRVDIAFDESITMRIGFDEVHCYHGEKLRCSGNSPGFFCQRQANCCVRRNAFRQ